MKNTKDLYGAYPTKNQIDNIISFVDQLSTIDPSIEINPSSYNTNTRWDIAATKIREKEDFDKNNIPLTLWAVNFGFKIDSIYEHAWMLNQFSPSRSLYHPVTKAFDTLTNNRAKTIGDALSLLTNYLESIDDIYSNLPEI